MPPRCRLCVRQISDRYIPLQVFTTATLLVNGTNRKGYNSAHTRTRPEPAKRDRRKVFFAKQISAWHILLHIFTKLNFICELHEKSTSINQGKHVDPPRCRRWARQISAWLMLHIFSQISTLFVNCTKTLKVCARAHTRTRPGAAFERGRSQLGMYFYIFLQA